MTAQQRRKPPRRATKKVNMVKRTDTPLYTETILALNFNPEVVINLGNYRGYESR